MKKHEVLYDIVFPLWSLLIMPSAWIFVIPINFIIDSVVLFFAMAFLEIQEKKKFYLHSVWKVLFIRIFSGFDWSSCIVASFVFSNFSNKFRWIIR